MSVTNPPAQSPSFVPALKPPPGVQPNPEHPDSLAYLTHITAGICLSIVTVFFLIRSYVRLFIKKTWIFEDWLCFVSWGGTVAYLAIMLVTATKHGGQHLWDITKDQAKVVAYWFWVNTVVYGVTICITKVAVLWLYRRVFSGRKGTLFDWEAIILIVILVGFYFSTCLVKIFECIPHAKIFDKTIPGTCVDVAVILETSGLFNTITDFLILLMPAQALWKLKMDFKKKVIYMLIFTFGLCAPVFSAVGYAARAKKSANPDTSWNQPELLLWAAAELTSGNLCVCFPEFGGLFGKRRERSAYKPNSSVYNSARATLTHLRPNIHNIHSSKDENELVSIRPYVEIKHEPEGQYGYQQEVRAERRKTETGDILPNSVRVEYTIEVESSSSRTM